MPTALAYIEAGMSKLGMLNAGETVSAEDAALGLLRLNSLLDAMENDGMFGYATLNTTFTLPASTNSRTIGAGQQINIVRPVRIMQGSYTRVDSNDYPIEPLNEAEYNAIRLKSTDSFVPVACFYDGGYPTGNVFFWPPPSAAVSVTIITPTAKTTAADTTTSIVYPPGYQRYIENALAIEMAPDFNAVVTPLLMSTAANARRLIKRQNSRVPSMNVDYPRRGGVSTEEFASGVF